MKPYLWLYTAVGQEAKSESQTMGFLRRPGAGIYHAHVSKAILALLAWFYLLLRSHGSILKQVTGMCQFLHNNSLQKAAVNKIKKGRGVGGVGNKIV